MSQRSDKNDRGGASPDLETKTNLSGFMEPSVPCSPASVNIPITPTLIGYGKK